MKKLENRKLHINRETLGLLQDSKLAALRGGLVPADSGAETCGTTTLSCFMRCTG